MKDFFVPALYFIIGGTRKKYKHITVISEFAIVLYSILQLYIGSRAYATMMLITLLMLHNFCIRKVKTKNFVIIVLMLSIIMAIVKIVRDIPRLNWGVIYYILNEYVSSKNPIFELIYEMGNMMNVTG